MSLLDVVRSSVAVADKVTKPLQAPVTHEAYVGQDGRGKRTYAAPVTRPAIVEKKSKAVKTPTGELTVNGTAITFLDPTVIVTDDDRITLPDGSTGPILTIDGMIDAGTGHPFLTDVFLG